VNEACLVQVNYNLPKELLYERLIDGEAYIVSKMLNIPADSSANVHIRNSHEDKVMFFGNISIFAEGSVEFYMHDSFDSISNGDNFTIQNALMDTSNSSPDSGPFVAHYNSTFTADESGTIPLGFTTSGGPADSKFVDVYPSAVEPDREVVIELDNQDSSENKSLTSILLITSY